MKIGIYLENWGENAGGGYAYSKTVVKYFSELKSKHEFLFILATTNNEISQDYQNISNAIIYNKKNITEKKKSLFPTIWKKVRGFISEKNSEFKENTDGDLFASLVSENEIKCIYYPTAFTCENIEIPFYTTVWDLGHLTNNVFPEISAKGEFQRRENVLRTLIQRSYKVISESEVGKSNICKFYNTMKEKVVVVPQFAAFNIDTNIESREVLDILEKLELSKGEFIFYPAQFWPHKNHINLLKAVLLLKKSVKEIKVVFVGSDQGNLKYVSRFIEENDLKGSVKYLGFVSSDTLKALYCSALCLVFPTFLGPTNMPIVEAMACGCPVICSDLDGHREQAGDAAIYFNPADPKDIADAISLVFRDEDLRLKCIEKGFEIAKEKSLNNVFVKLLKSFDEFENIRSTWD